MKALFYPHPGPAGARAPFLAMVLLQHADGTANLQVLIPDQAPAVLGGVPRGEGPGTWAPEKTQVLPTQAQELPTQPPAFDLETALPPPISRATVEDLDEAWEGKREALAAEAVHESFVPRRPPPGARRDVAGCFNCANATKDGDRGWTCSLANVPACGPWSKAPLLWEMRE